MPKLSERVPWLFQQSFQVGWLKELAEEVEAQRGRLDILEGKHKEQAPVDRRLVEKALEAAVRLHTSLNLAGITWDVAKMVQLLRRALEGDSDDPDCRRMARTG